MQSQPSISSIALENIYNEAKDFILIGLTGRTGSGCSTSAAILSDSCLDLPESGYEGITENELRKFKIIKRYISKQWRKFHWLQIRTIITKHLISLPFDELIQFISSSLNKNYASIEEALLPLKLETDVLRKVIIENEPTSKISPDERKEQEETIYHLYFEILPKFSNTLRDTLKNISGNAYTKIYQTAGDNIRSSGFANDNKFNADRIFDFARSINRIVKATHHYCKNKGVPCYITIDAIRNPYEALFFRERYADFYLVSINTENQNRLDHLRSAHKFTELQIEELDKKEYPSKLQGEQKFISQNIQKCIEISDIHIHNPRVDQFNHIELRCQLAWYVALIMHPGLVPPTSIETCMQIAYSVKQSSGCISRQVGAAVTDSEYSLKSVGWNSTPQGQVPCILRSADDLIRGEDTEAYSTYEKSNVSFRNKIKLIYSDLQESTLLNGRSLPYCFKDIQNEINNEKNQVHTRSLHAEENAFLQISKYGGQRLRGGVLFTTASPCELCAKKAYQLGISLIVYIDPYPGIATSHILSSGSNCPTLKLFRGAVGRAYHQLYQPIMPFKDELETILSLTKPHKTIDNEVNKLLQENKALNEENQRLRELLALST